MTNDRFRAPCVPELVYATGDDRADGAVPLPRCTECTLANWQQAERRAQAKRRVRRVPNALTSLPKDPVLRQAQMMTLQVRNFSCDYTLLGSGFALDAHTLITNRHVLVGGLVYEVDAFDGSSQQVQLSGAQSARLVDIGFAHVDSSLPRIAKSGPEPLVGASVTAVGYPLGGKLRFSHGAVLEYVNARRLPAEIAFDGQAIEIAATLYHGDSGGPLLDSQGRVVGVVYAGKFAPGADMSSPSEVAYAIPLSAVHRLLARGGTEAISPCG